MYRCICRFIVFLHVLGLLFVTTNAISQEISKASFTNSFGSYSHKAIQEKLFVHTDKEFYVAGEILWFRIFYVDGATNMPGELSKVAYTEIINEKGQPVLQAKISLAHGESNGSFYLPASLNTGYYTVRAYTRWMKNFDSTCFFEKRIAILNTLKNPESSASAAPDVSVNFFPEGGNLVSDIQSRVGVMVNKVNGGVADYKGYIIDKNNDTVTSFTPLKFGIGQFNFRPVTGNTYKAIIVFPDNTTLSKSLPEIFENGYGINVTDNNSGQISVTIHRKKMAGEANNIRILLAAHTRQALDVVENAGLNDNDSVTILIDKNKLRKGVTHFTLFNEQGSPLCERLFYNPPGKTVSLQAETDHDLYQKRQQINIAIKSQDAGAEQSPLDLSASVFHLDSLQTMPESTINEYMWLTSELPGNIESPGYYFSDDPDVKTAADNLMLTQGWRRFNWKDVISGGNSFIKYLPEINGQLITGTVRRKKDNSPVSNISACLSIPGHIYIFSVSQSDKQGMVYFEVKGYYGNKQFIPQVLAGDSLWLDMSKPYAVTANMQHYPSYAVSENYKDEILKRSIAMQAQNVYLADSLRNFNEPIVTDTLPFFGIGEAVYMLDDYRRFTTMEEVLREYVREIGVGTRNGKPIIKIFNPVANDFFDGNALVLLDGVPLNDVNKIFQYNPLNVKRLEVIRSRYVLGASIFEGVVSLATYDGVFDGFELDPKIVSIDYPGLQLQREFYSPAYGTKEQLEKRIPDYRNTLLWSPSVTTSKDGKASLQFYSSDVPGKYVVVVQGMNAKGEFVYTSHSFDVK